MSRKSADLKPETSMVKNDSINWAGLLRRDVALICLFLFTTDMIIGTITSTLSLFAQSLGASLTLVGILATVLGVARFGAGIVLGDISDRRGRKSILTAGMGLMGVACLLYALTSIPYMLIFINLLFGLSFVACLTIGLAYAADISTIRERSLVFGLATASMGFGFAMGSLMGGTVATRFGYSGAYLVAMGLALMGVVAVWRGLPDLPRRANSGPTGTPSLRQQLGVLMANPIILAACVGSILSNLVFGGLILTFFPIYAHGLGYTQAVIGSMFATRAMASTLARLPAGILGVYFPGRVIMLVALVMSTGVAFMLVQYTGPAVLMGLLVVEGVAYGLYLTSGQATVAGHAGEANRGAALGIYMASASMGDSLMPLFLGAVADAFGIESVFYIVGGVAVVGLAILARIIARPTGHSPRGVG